ncbi:MAG: NADH-quinone oxidoreductase subunit NuoE [Deltaproteobacteria bacterium]|nr:NADH-quinone oxidoreductase subunit NuoE [Deltaproteobacteria bacterium]
MEAARVEESVDLSVADRIIAEHASGSGSLIPVLQKAQEEYGYLPKQVMDRIARGLHLPPASVYGVVTFYAQFRLKPVGKHIIRVCHGTACHVSGADKITESFSRDLSVEDGETTSDRLFTLESVACLGCCSLAPVAMVGEETFGRLDGVAVRRLIKDYRKQESA